MMKALLDGDLVVATASGTGVEGIDLPENLMAVPVGRLRAHHGVLIDASANTAWFIDPQGRKHILQTDPSWQPLECALNQILVQDSGGVWGLYNPVPRSVSPLQMRKALRLQNLRASVDAYLEDADEEVREDWEYATQIERSNALLIAAAQALGKTEADLDDLFRLAATL